MIFPTPCSLFWARELHMNCPSHAPSGVLKKAGIHDSFREMLSTMPLTDTTWPGGSSWVPWFNTTLRPQWRKAYGQRQRCTCFQNPSLFSARMISIHICSRTPRSQGFPLCVWLTFCLGNKSLRFFSLCRLFLSFTYFFPMSHAFRASVYCFWTWAIRCRNAKKLTSSFLQAPPPPPPSPTPPVWTLISSNFYLSHRGKRPISFQSCLTKVENYL